MTVSTEKNLDGCWHRVIDDHGRLTLPSKVRGEFLNGVVLSPGPTANCVAIWPTRRFEAFVAGASKAGSDARREDPLASTSQAGECDRNGRVTVPACLREHGGLTDGAAMVIGAGDYLEVWDPRIAPRRTLTERFITGAVASICARDERFCLGLVRALLQGAVSQLQGRQRETSQELVRRLPRRHLKLISEKSVPHEGLVDIWRNDWESRIDWLFLGDSFALAVEVKTNSSTPLGERQLELYYRALKDKHLDIHRPHWGVLVLVPQRRVVMSARRRPRFLGVLLWEEIGPALRALTPADPHDAKLWAKILDGVLPTPGDVRSVLGG